MKQLFLILAALLLSVHFSATAQLVNKNKTIMVKVNQPVYKLFENKSLYKSVMPKPFSVDTKGTGNVMNYIDYEIITSGAMTDEDYVQLGGAMIVVDRYIRGAVWFVNYYVGACKSAEVIGAFEDGLITNPGRVEDWNMFISSFAMGLDEEAAKTRVLKTNIAKYSNGMTYIGTPEKMKGEVAGSGVRRYMVFKCGDGKEHAVQIYTFGKELKVSVLE